MAAAMRPRDRRARRRSSVARRLSTTSRGMVVAATLEPGQTLRIVKFLAYGWSRRRSTPALLDQVSAALSEAHTTGWDGLCAEQREYLDDFWDRADVEIEGDRRAAAGHPLRAVPRPAGRRPGRAAGDRRQGTDGLRLRRTHVLGHRDVRAPGAHLHARRRPRATHCAGGTRRSTAPASAREQLELAGAAFPWRTIHGEECSGYWPAGTAAFHINADIAAAVVRYLKATRTTRRSRREVGIELLVETARLWHSLGHHDAHGALPDRRRHRTRRVQRDRRQQRLHQPDGPAEPARGRRGGRALSEIARRARRRPRGDSGLA